MLESAKELAYAIAVSLQENGFSAFLVGGCVRDLLIGVEPKDYDVATSAKPEQVIELFPGSNLVGAHFGVVLVRNGDAQVEVATYRRDHEYLDGRRPESVTFEQHPQQDALRRDFTVNALFLDPRTGQVVDYVGGRPDLDAKVIRAIGDPVVRFSEDHLRMLRAIRFAARLGFAIDPATMEAIRETRSFIQGVSAERVRDELSRMLTGPNSRRAFELLDQTRLLQEVLPEVAGLKGVEQPAAFHPEGDVWTHTMLMLEGLEQPSLTLALGVLLHDIGKPETFERAHDRIRFNGHVEAGVRIARGLLNRLRFSNEQIEQVLALIDNHMKFKDVPQMRESTLKRFLRQPEFQEHLALHRLDCLSSHGSLANYDYAKQRMEDNPQESLRPQLLITGGDLIRAGYKPGPSFRRALVAVEDAQLNGEISSAADALALAQRVLTFEP